MNPERRGRTLVEPGSTWFCPATEGHDRGMRFVLRLLANMGALAAATWLLSGITLTAPTTGRKVSPCSSWR